MTLGTRLVYLIYQKKPFFSPKHHFDNQSKDAQYRKVNENKYYFETMCKSKFVLCLCGESPWSFRFYEALMCKSIPIVNSIFFTYRTEEESNIPYFFYLYNNFTTYKYDKEIVNYNTALIKKYHLFN